MNAPLRSKNKKDFAVRGHHRNSSHRPGNRLPALLALGGSCALVCGSAAALELGPIEVHSSLGQPLRASVAFALNPGELIHDYCIFLNGGRAANGLPAVNRAEIAVSGGSIRVTGHAAVREPLLSLQLTVACPKAANLTREYSILVDPQTSPWAEPALPAVAEPTARARPPAPAPLERVQEVRPKPVARPAPAARPAERAPVASGSTYRVQRGDTLSGIAQRIPGRAVTIWQAADAIFAANPGAFLNDDPDRLQAGTLLVIPDTLQAPVAESARSATVPPAAPAEPVAEPAAHVSTAAPAPAAELATPAEAVAPAPSLSETPGAGDVASGVDGPFAAPDESSATSAPVAEPSAAVTAETPAAMPAAREPSPAGGRSPVVTGGEERSWSSLGWLGGSGVLLILGLLFGGKALKYRFARDPAALPADGVDDFTDDSAGGATGNELPEVDFRFDEPVANARLIALDADLDAGTGLQDGGDIHFAQDFGFSAAGDLQAPLDIEFAAEPLLRQSDDGSAVITAERRAPDGILVSEILPGSDEEFSQYDLSMIVDATQQPAPDSDATTKDLKAIQLDAGDGLLENSEPQTLGGEPDYKILEQDYEDELTATQALNAQLAAAARELSREFLSGPEDSTEPALPAVLSVDLDLDLTAARLQSGDTTAIERTVEMPANAESRPVGNAEDTGVNEELTTEMPAAENDAVADLEIESATIDTRKMKVS